MLSIQPLYLSVFILHQLFLHFFTINNLPFSNLTIGLENFEDLLNNILSSITINELPFFNWEI
ncbi:uncharacterized protein METZ01_LOCUS425814 [marine metagenome]|uniref:Uncharacterized protein n=1 Tax=marine metagenome TaxID=408172 RepID=A0A382XQ37_9ZZZZ